MPVPRSLTRMSTPPSLPLKSLSRAPSWSNLTNNTNPALATTKRMLLKACADIGLSTVTVFCTVADLVTVLRAILANKDAVEVINIDIRVSNNLLMPHAARAWCDGGVKHCAYLADVHHLISSSVEAVAGLLFPKLHTLSVTVVGDKQSTSTAKLDLGSHFCVFDIQQTLLQFLGANVRTLSLSPCANDFLHTSANSSPPCSSSSPPASSSTSAAATALSLSQLCPRLNKLELYGRISFMDCNLLRSNASPINVTNDALETCSCAVSAGNMSFQQLTRFRYVYTGPDTMGSSNGATASISAATGPYAQGSGLRDTLTTITTASDNFDDIFEFPMIPSNSLDSVDATTTAASEDSFNLNLLSSFSFDEDSDDEDADIEVGAINDNSLEVLDEAAQGVVLAMPALQTLEIEETWQTPAQAARTVALFPPCVQSLILCADMSEQVTHVLRSLARTASGFCCLQSIQLRDMCFVTLHDRLHSHSSIGAELTQLVSLCPTLAHISLPAMRIDSPVLFSLTNMHSTGGSHAPQLLHQPLHRHINGWRVQGGLGDSTIELSNHPSALHR